MVNPVFWTPFNHSYLATAVNESIDPSGPVQQPGSDVNVATNGILDGIDCPQVCSVRDVHEIRVNLSCYAQR